MFEDKIKKAGYKLTKPRKLVLKILEKNEHPLSAQDLYESLGKKIDLASVYRTLNLFESLNIIFKERFNSKELFYLSDKQHHHVLCRKCGCSKCIPCDHLFSNIKDFSNIIHNLNMSGICNNCSKN